MLRDGECYRKLEPWPCVNVENSVSSLRDFAQMFQI